MEKKEFCKDIKVTNVIKGDFDHITLSLDLPKDIKAKHIDNKGTLREDNLISINGNQIFNATISGDETTANYVAALDALCVGFQMKPYIYKALFKGAICSFDVVHGQKGETDKETGREYTREAYSYRLKAITLAELNPLIQQLILGDIQNGSIKEPKATPAPATASIFAGLANIRL